MMQRQHPGLLPLRTLLLVAAAAALVAAARAQEPVLLERIVAIVDEEMILQSDLDLAVELYQLDRQLAGVTPEPLTPALREEVLDSLIENKLVIAAAKQNDMVVEEADIDARVEERVNQLVDQYDGMANLQQALRESGLTLDDFRFRYANQLRNQQYMRLVVGRFIRPDIEVMENEVEQYYLDHLEEMPAEPDSVALSSIMVRVQPSADTRQQVQAGVAAAQQALAAGQDFASVARRFSQGPNANRGGRIGAVKPGDLFDRVLNQTLAELPVGQVSQPVVSSRGVHLLLVEAENPDGSKLLSQLFYPIEVTEADVAAAQQRIMAARERVLGGEAFSLVAAEVSEDPVSAASGGVMGTFQLDQLAPGFQEVLAGLQPGEVSEPLLTDAGWYVFQVLERTDGHQYTYDELAGELRQYVESQKIEAALSEYIDDLRDRYFVEIKD